MNRNSPPPTHNTFKENRVITLQLLFRVGLLRYRLILFNPPLRPAALLISSLTYIGMSEFLWRSCSNVIPESPFKANFTYASNYARKNSDWANAESEPFHHLVLVPLERLLFLVLANPATELEIKSLLDSLSTDW